MEKNLLADLFIFARTTTFPLLLVWLLLQLGLHAQVRLQLSPAYQISGANVSSIPLVMLLEACVIKLMANHVFISFIEWKASLKSQPQQFSSKEFFKTALELLRSAFGLLGFEKSCSYPASSDLIVLRFGLFSIHFLHSLSPVYSEPLRNQREQNNRSQSRF